MGDLTEEQKKKLDDWIDWKVVLKSDLPSTVQAGAAFVRSLLPRLGFMTNVAATRAVFQLSSGQPDEPAQDEAVQRYKMAFTDYFHSRWNQEQEHTCAKKREAETLPAPQAPELNELVQRALAAHTASVAQALYLHRAKHPPRVTAREAVSEVPSQNLIEGFEVVPSPDLLFLRGNAEGHWGNVLNHRFMRQLLDPVLGSMPTTRVNDQPVLVDGSEACRRFFESLPKEKLEQRLGGDPNFVWVAYRYELNPGALVNVGDSRPDHPSARALPEDMERYHRDVATFEAQAKPKTFFLLMRIPRPAQAELQPMTITPERAHAMERHLQKERMRQTAFQTAVKAGDVNALKQLAEQGHPGAQWEYAYRVRRDEDKKDLSKEFLARAQAQGLPGFEARDEQRRPQAGPQGGNGLAAVNRLNAQYIRARQDGNIEQAQTILEEIQRLQAENAANALYPPPPVEYNYYGEAPLVDARGIVWGPVVDPVRAHQTAARQAFERFRAQGGQPPPALIPPSHPPIASPGPEDPAVARQEAEAAIQLLLRRVGPGVRVRMAGEEENPRLLDDFGRGPWSIPSPSPGPDLRPAY